jgi:hypothetical protein
MNAKHVKDQEQKVGPKQGVFLLFMYGFAHCCSQLFAEHGNSSSNYAVS